MNKKILSIVSLLLAMLMLLGTFASCTQGNNGNENDSSDDSTQESEESSETKTPGEDQEDDSEQILISGNNSELIHLANKLANGVSPYYTDSSRNELTIENTEMKLGYNMTHTGAGMLVSHISNKDGHNYIKDTMDVFIQMTGNDDYYYASHSADIGSVLQNIYRYGYYYYENRFENQTFITDIIPNNTRVLNVSNLASNQIDNVQIFKDDDGSRGVSYTIAGSDPWIHLNGTSLKADDYDFLEVKIKAEATTGTCEIFIIAGDKGGFTQDQMETISLITDGEAHVYRIPLNQFSGYKGTLRGIRFDVNGTVGSKVEISSLKVFKGEQVGVEDLTIQRSFLTYSDKLHHLLQVSAYEEVEGIQKIGMTTKIPVDSVDKLVINVTSPKGSTLYNELSGKIAWNHVKYVGFDIKDAGIFGFILPYDGSGGNIRVTVEDGNYVIEQYKAPSGSKIQPSCEYYPDKKAQEGRYTTIVTNNANDFFMGQRIYTDENHTFEQFIYEAECEINPLTEENVVIDTLNSDSGTFKGYDPLRGYYKFTVAGTGFNQAYFKYPNKHYSVKFTVTGDKYDRQMYFMSYTSSGQLECAALLDDKQMLLPVPLEVAKNFQGDGENTIYNNEDRAYGETFFPMILKAGETKGYTIVNLYQNWGKVPLKQISSIQYFSPYYHLSTGVTETNCIVPFAVSGPALPDFRGMSAPLWKSQPQHTSGGGHSFLTYTDGEGLYQTSDTTGVKIDSYGPTYADIAIDFLSSDSKIKATYTHMEMPQTDENRSYYTLEYEVLEDLYIADFKNKFRFYYCTDNNSTGSYKKLGYLDEYNEYQVVDVASSADYVLGNECPYFSLFMMPDWMRDNPHAEGYTNLAFLIYDSEFIINGEKIDANFYLRNRGGTASLSLNLGDVELKKGDTFTINAILMPWGSQELEDDPANRYNKDHTNGYTEYTYSTVLPDGTLYMDKNVRDVRENTLLNPFKATADKDCEVIESAFIAKVKTTNGKTAEFTLSGGHNNSTVRVYGFDKLTVPYIEEYVDGKWQEYVVSSKDSPDMYGFYHFYDGYMVNYDGDGTYSYSFVVPMDNGAPRKFRISAAEDFKGWPEVDEGDSGIVDDPINYFLQPQEIMLNSSASTSIAGAELAGDKSSVNLFGHSTVAETYYHFFKNNAADPMVTGQYVVVKYKVPTGMNNISQFEFFATTDLSYTAAIGDHRVSVNATTDDQWHVLIINLADACKEGVFVPNKDGEYTASFIRWDFLNQKVSSDMYLEIAYFGLHDNLKDIYAMELNKEIVPTETPKYIELVEGGKTVKVDPTTGEAYVPTYVHKDSGYKISDVEYAAYIDYINRVQNKYGIHNDRDVVETRNPTAQTIGDGLLVLTGWCVAEGGVEKYVWSADGGKTWYDVVMYNGIPLQSADDAMIEAFGSIKSYKDADGNTIKPQVQDVAASKVNGSFAGNRGICADLLNYYESGTIVDVTFAAVPKADTSSLCILAHITDVQVFEAPPFVPSETVNMLLTPEAMYNKVTSVASYYTFASAELSTDKTYMRLNAKADAGDQYGLVMNGNATAVGQYLFIKYRIPTGMSTLSKFEVFTSTVNAHFVAGNNFSITGLIQDNDWHVVVVDVAQKLPTTAFAMNDEGKYAPKYLRIDFFEEKAAAGMYIDIAASGFADNLDVIFKEVCADMDFVTVVGSSSNKVDPSTGEVYTPTYVHKDSGYNVSDVEYAAWIDYINGEASSGSAHNAKAVLEKSCPGGTTMSGTKNLVLTGWAVADGGIEKYVWSADGGKTWHDVGIYNSLPIENASDAYFNAYGSIKSYIDPITGEKVVPAVADMEASKANSGFQGGGGIVADLSEYSGKTVNVTFAAVPKADTDSLCILVHVTGVSVPAN